ncbi:MAG: hypothetical protein F6J90_35140 [Moorea sp. SIOASIH]|uniref:hypothetical protein n=1 Tax=Moorena sp. SIOASIH TaxID=2607817 RepID=UPI0013BAF4B5|nr:hypothetical protein [Moorena sp. SIOASIH]NEO41282.1 hypothetical protein [Moorena sp. SIOASIH]
MERASGVELASCQFPAWFRASGVELASCQFPAWFRASGVELASCQFPAWFRASWWNWHLASFLPGFGHLGGTGILPVSCLVSGILVELASCQFPTSFRAAPTKREESEHQKILPISPSPQTPYSLLPTPYSLP